MASAALRIAIELETVMAVGAIHLRMRLVKLQAGYGMLEIGPIPTGVAGDTFRGQFRDGPPGRMTRPATETIVEFIEFPADVGMGKRRLFLRVMTGGTAVPTVTGVARGMDVLRGSRERGAAAFLKPRQVVTTAAVFLLMAIDAP